MIDKTGRVDCQCGDQILSNSGKAMWIAAPEGNISKYMKCWNPDCDGAYLGEDIYNARIEGSSVKFDDTTDIKVFRVGDDPYDWVAAKTKKEAFDYFTEYYDGEDYEIDDYDESSIYQMCLTDDGEQITIKKIIDNSDKSDFPCIIVSTEF